MTAGMTDPVAFGLADELPLARPEPTPFWSENYCFDLFDPARNIALWLHIGRWWRDPTIWREQIILLLPDGRTMIARQYGAPDIREGIVSSSLALRFRSAGKSIHLGYAGAVREMGHTAIDQPAVETPNHLLRMDLTLEASGAIWDFAGGEGHELRGSGHYEQAMRAIGDINFDGAPMRFDGVAYRDHSRGGRDIAGFGGHVYMHGQFPDGRGFGLYDISMRTDAGIAPAGEPRAAMFEHGAVHPATVDRVPRLVGYDDPAEPFSIRFTSAIGAMDIEATPRRRAMFTLAHPFDYFSGILPSTGLAAIVEDFCTFRTNGLDGAGLTERSYVFR